MTSAEWYASAFTGPVGNSVSEAILCSQEVLWPDHASPRRRPCVVHLVRRSLAYVSYQDRKRVAAVLRTLYRAETVAAGEAALAAFAVSPDGLRYPTIAPIWRRQWDLVTPAFA
ncbi:MAG: transposase [Gemmatimonadales bacterium]